jgi:Sulfur transfer protein involved in thiamine biosynthesis
MSIVHDLNTTVLKEGETARLDEFITRHGFKPELVMVRLEGEIVKKADLGVTRIKKGSDVKVYKLVGGG